LFVASVAAFKGGTGKTTVTFNVGMEFARPRRYRGVGRTPVLFVDADPQAVVGHEGSGAPNCLFKLFEVGPFELEPIGFEAGGFEVFKVEFAPDGHETVDPNAGIHDLVFVARPAESSREMYGRVNVRELLDEFEGVFPGNEGLALIDTPPLNVELEVARRMLENSDVVVPVLNFSSYNQIQRFLDKEEFRVRFAVVNMVPRVNTLELKEIMEDLEGFLRGTPLRREDVIFVPHDHALNTCTVKGIPARCRRYRPDSAPKFHEIALHLRGEMVKKEGS